MDSTDALSRYICSARMDIYIIGRAGASPPSCTTGPRCLYIYIYVYVPPGCATRPVDQLAIRMVNPGLFHPVDQPAG